MNYNDLTNEKINPDTLEPGFQAEKWIMGKYLMKAQARTVDPDDGVRGIVIHVFDPKATSIWLQKSGIAHGRFIQHKDHVETSFVTVDTDYQRQGIASAMYNWVRELGNDVMPSHAQSADAKAFWAAGAGQGKEFPNQPPEPEAPTEPQQEIQPKSQSALGKFFKMLKLRDSVEKNKTDIRPGNIEILTPIEFINQHPLEDDIEEATKLAAPSRELNGDELTQYLDRIRNQEKTKSDKYKFPYMHRSSVVSYYNTEGKKYNVDAIKSALAQRPKSLLKKNEKMKHSDGQLEQFFNLGFAALTGIALDQGSNELIVVNTCPGAGSCKVDCFAMKGNKIMFQGPWLSDGKLLTYLLNDPDGFFAQLKSEIEKEAKKGAKEGYKVSIRWHDSGDFFSPEYVNLAYKLAQALPNVDFYAYTKIADVALGKKPKNFIINWSEGAHTSQEKKVKAKDPALATTKNSRIVPKELFYDLLIKDGSKLVKGPEGQWQVIPERLPELKQRLAKEYGISANSILSYNEWETRGRTNTSMKWNVIIAPGEPDLTAKDPGVLSTLLLKH